MDFEYIPIKLFILGENLEQADFLEKFKRADIFYFNDFFSALAHIHLHPDFVFIRDLELSGEMSAADFLTQLAELSPSSQSVYVASSPKLQLAVQLMKKGLKDYIPSEAFDSVYFSELLEKFSGEKWNTEEQRKTLITDKFRELGFLGTGRRMRKLYKLIEDVSRSDINLLIEGEPGCEQLLAANAVHRLSKRRVGPFVHFDVLAYSVESVEFEIFGREKDSNTGILKRKIGAIESASGGSLCIDNIEALPIYIQSRLLRAIREKKYLKPGGPNIVFWNTRLIVIASKSLEKDVKNQNLLDELLRTISGFTIRIAPLRDRGQDIITMANNFLRTFLRINRIKALTLSLSAKELLLQYSFPGNVQELKSAVEAAALMARGDEIEKGDLVFKNKPLTELFNEEELTLEQYTEKIISAYLEKYNNDVILTASKLGIGKSTIYRMLQKNKNPNPKTDSNV
jgi:two-component system, NtrC family, response regulator AtoC